MIRLKMAGVFRREEGALMVIEPPGQLRVARVLEVHNRILVPIEERFFEDLSESDVAALARLRRSGLVHAEVPNG